MKILKTIVIDDEQNNIDNIQQLLTTYCPEADIIATAGNAEDGKAAILQHRPDLIMLDIQMPGKTGFDLLRELGRYDFEVIFITAYDQYAIQAIKFAAVDYLMKPVNITELKVAVANAADRVRLKKQNLQLENLLQLLRQEKETHRIALTTLKETRFIPTADIIRCESSNNYSIFTISNGEKLIVSKPIYEYEALLANYGFIRCHQSHLVNKKQVKSWVKEDGGYLLLQNGDQVPVSRNKKDAVLLSLQ